MEVLGVFGHDPVEVAQGRANVPLHIGALSPEDLGSGWGRTGGLGARAPAAGQPDGAKGQDPWGKDGTVRHVNSTRLAGGHRTLKQQTLGGPTSRVKRGLRWAPRVLAGLALAGLAGCGSPGDPPPGAANKPGYAAYTKYCAKCHDDDGRSTRASRIKKEPLSLVDPAWADTVSDAYLERVADVGKGRMRGLGRKLSPEELRMVAGYVRWLSTAPPASHR
jgi:mono/diheme cytochrome c family protein